jgi:hypothetical protein
MNDEIEGCLLSPDRSLPGSAPARVKGKLKVVARRWPRLAGLRLASVTNRACANTFCQGPIDACPTRMESFGDGRRENSVQSGSILFLLTVRILGVARVKIGLNDGIFMSDTPLTFELALEGFLRW